jgi:hypothetical protein
MRLLALIATLATVASAARAQSPTIACADSSKSGVLGSTACTIFAKRPVALTGATTQWRIETYPTRDAAERASTATSAVLPLDGSFWLLSVGSERPTPAGGTLVANVGPLPLPKASNYEMILAYVAVPPGAKSAVHVQSGPEAWFVLDGSQCVETPDTVLHLDRAHPGFVPADTPLFLIATGNVTRRALFVIVHDASRAFFSEINSWKPKGRCQ